MERGSAIERFERLLLAVALIGLALTGLPQSYTGTSWAQALIVLLGGIESARILHRLLAILLLAASSFHVLAFLYRRLALRQGDTRLPGVQDWRHLVERVLVNLGLRSALPADETFVFKIENLVLIVSLAILIVTGIVLWNPVAVTNTLPGETIPVAQSVHGQHALLLVIFLVVWRLLIVLFWRRAARPTTSQVSDQRRGRSFVPVALVITLALTAALVGFLNAEQTAIDTVPRRQAAVFAPQAIAASGDAGVGAALWATQRCAFCHGEQAGGGVNGEPALKGRSDLTFNAFYQQVRQGGEQMPVFSLEELPDSYVTHLWAWLSQ
jgi:cytochrome b subunit of formate dehydrogenase